MSLSMHTILCSGRYLEEIGKNQIWKFYLGNERLTITKQGENIYNI